MLQLKAWSSQIKKEVKKKKPQMQHLVEYLASLFYKGGLGESLMKKKACMCVHVDGVFLKGKVYLS